MAIYLDCNATSPLDARVKELMLHYMEIEYGNAGSRTHEFGAEANRAVQNARRQVASVVDAKPDEVIFTSGATEANNIAILGLAAYGRAHNKMHVVSTKIEHKAVLEPLEFLATQGFEIELAPPTPGGWVDPEAVHQLVRDETLLVSVMHVNNETGIIQPIGEIATTLTDWDGVFHVDAAQGFGKELISLRDPRIDLISTSAHKVFGPKGVGALIARRRNFQRAPISPLFHGGGQERGLRPGTLPVPLLVGFGLACDLALKEATQRATACQRRREELLDALGSIDFAAHGDSTRCMPHVFNFSVPGVDSEAAMVTLRGLIAISNGSACTSESYEPSHVLRSMGLPESSVLGALRISWCHNTEPVDWVQVVKRIGLLSS